MLIIIILYSYIGFLIAYKLLEVQDDSGLYSNNFLLLF